MEFKTHLKTSLKLLVGTIIAYVLGRLTEIDFFLWIGVMAGVWLALHLYSLGFYVIRYLSEAPSANPDGKPKYPYELQIPLLEFIVSIRIYRRKEKNTWN